jgi:hypothetical protein
MQTGTAELLEGVFKLRAHESGRLDADFVLTLRTPEGVEHWGFDWGLQDVVIDGTEGRTPRERLDFFMRSLFDDHMYDLGMRGLRPDRGYDDVPIRLEIPIELEERLS